MLSARRPLIADLALVLVTFIWGATFTVVKEALRDIEPFAFLMLRFGMASLIILPFMLRTGRIRSLPLLPGLLAGSSLFLGYMAQTVGLQYTSASKSGFITGLSVVLVPIFVAVLERRSLQRRIIFSILLAVLGLYLLTNPHAQAFNRGDAWTLLCAVGFALHIIVLDYYTRRVDYLGLFFVQIALVSLLSGITYPFETEFTFELGLSLTPNVLWALIITAVFATAVAFFLQNWAQRITTASRTALILTLEPVFAALTAYVVLSESLGLMGILGGCFILTAIIFAELNTRLPAQGDGV